MLTPGSKNARQILATVLSLSLFILSGAGCESTPPITAVTGEVDAGAGDTGAIPSRLGKSTKPAIHEHEMSDTGILADPGQTVLLELEGPSLSPEYDSGEFGVDHVDYLFDEESLFRFCIHKESLREHRFELVRLRDGVSLGETGRGEPCIDTDVEPGVYRLKVTHEAFFEEDKQQDVAHVFLEPVLLNDGGGKGDWASTCSQIEVGIPVAGGLGCTAMGASDGNCTLCKLAGIEAVGLTFKNVSFDFANFSDATDPSQPWATSNKSSFHNCFFDNCSFKSAKMERLDFSGSSFTAVNLTNANLSSAILTDTTFDKNSLFENTELGNTRFVRVKMDSIDLTTVKTDTGPIRLLPTSMEGFTASPADDECAVHQNDLSDCTVDAHAFELFELAQKDVNGTQCTLYNNLTAKLSGSFQGHDFAGNLGANPYSGGSRSLANLILDMADGLDLSESNWAYSEAPFAGRPFPNMNLEGANLSGLNFEGGDLSTVTIDQETIFMDASLKDAKAEFNDLNLSNAQWSKVDLTNANLARSNLQNADLTYAVLTGVTAWSANFDGAALDNADLAGSATNTFENSTFRNATFENADLSGAHMVGVQLHGASTNLMSTTLVGTNFTRANLSSANFRQADARGAIFVDAQLTGADLQEAKFGPDSQNQAASFNNAYLCGANLKQTELYGADLTGAYAPLVQKDLQDEEGNSFSCNAIAISDPEINQQTICPDGTKASESGCAEGQWSLPQDPPPPCCVATIFHFCKNRLGAGESCTTGCDCQSDNCFQGSCK